MIEPWDGPASIAFSDGTCIGAVLDRNGLRPCRYTVTKDDLVIMASETGVLEVQPQNVRSKGRLQPGRMFLIDIEKGRIVEDEEIKAQIAARKPKLLQGCRKMDSKDHLKNGYLPLQSYRGAQIFECVGLNSGQFNRKRNCSKS